MDEYERNQERKVNVVIFIICIIVGSLLLSGCRSVKYVPVETVRIDSINVVKVEKDIVYEKDSVFVMVKGDTVFRDRTKIVYRDKLLCDTMYIERRDSVEVPVLVEKELSWIQQKELDYAGLSIGINFILVAIIACIIRKKGGIR